MTGTYNITNFVQCMVVPVFSFIVGAWVSGWTHESTQEKKLQAKPGMIKARSHSE